MSDSDKIELLATHGLEFQGVLQLMRMGDESSRMLREDCPKGEHLDCIQIIPNPCPFLSSIRRNKEEKSFWIVCNCTQRTKH